MGEGEWQVFPAQYGSKETGYYGELA